MRAASMTGANTLHRIRIASGLDTQDSLPPPSMTDVLLLAPCILPFAS